ncbi:MAG: DUF58 domain-containing protein [Pseudomonadota bacterium]|nr:DUF58 domain-containing protein [Pseudomonadota bacterium]
MKLSLAQRIQQHPRVQRWLRRRLPPTSAITLSQRQIFIFLSNEGVLYSVLLLVVFIAGVNYANNLILGFCFFLGSVLVITIHHTYAHLSGLHIEAVEAVDSEVGGRALYQIRVAPTGQRPHRQIRLVWADQEQIIDTLADTHVLSFALPTIQRGLFEPPRLTVSTVYPLGILRAWSYVHLDRTVWVAPEPIECELHGGGLSQALDDEQAVNRVSGQDEFEGLNPFIAGESMARISWAHLARGQGLLSKQFSDPQGQQQVLDYAQMPAASHELRLSYLAYWVKQLALQQMSFGLRLPQAELPVGSGERHLRAALQMLAEHP